MQWLNNIVDELLDDNPEGEIVVSSGVSPSGKYHVGTLREVLTADALYRGLKLRGRAARHIHVVDDLDPLRKIPAGIPSEYEKYLGQPLCDVPAPDGSKQSYADYYLDDFLSNTGKLGIDMEVLRSHEKYRAGYFVQAIETTLSKIDVVRECLESISGRSLDEQWSPIQVNEEGYLKKRPFVAIDVDAKTIRYLDKDGAEQSIAYDKGQVKLDWRLDWPARWSLLGIDAEPFGRDHASKGGSYDTGKVLVQRIFDGQPPFPVPYHFINRAGATKKMSKSAGDTVTISELLQVIPPEIVRFFVLRFSPDKQLFFDQGEGVVRLIDEYAALVAKPDPTPEDQLLKSIALAGNTNQVISNVPFSHLVASYQAALKDKDETLNIVARTEHGDTAGAQAEVIKRELDYIDQWLKKWAPEEVNFELIAKVEPGHFSELEKAYLSKLADQVESAPQDADGEWFHQAIYELKDQTGLEPKQLFTILYRALIGKDSGPRAGWFLSILPRDWLIKRLRLEN